MSADELKHICDMTVELTRIRQSACKTLKVESFATELFSKLLLEYDMRDAQIKASDTTGSPKP